MGGSSVVEASIIVPLILGIFLLSMRGGIGLYRQICEREQQEEIVSQWEVDDFYRYVKVNEMLQKGDSDDK